MYLDGLFSRSCGYVISSLWIYLYFNFLKYYHIFYLSSYCELHLIWFSSIPCKVYWILHIVKRFQIIFCDNCVRHACHIEPEALLSKLRNPVGSQPANHYFSSRNVFTFKPTFVNDRFFLWAWSSRLCPPPRLCSIPYKTNSSGPAAGDRLGNGGLERSCSLLFLKSVFVKDLQRWNLEHLSSPQRRLMNACFI